MKYKYNMKIYVDKTGFPLVGTKELGLFQLWPVTKIQFERFISETNTFGDKWYDSILKLNPRISCKSFDRNNYEGLFITSITPQEALSFAYWLGEGFDLPSVDEWRNFSQMLRTESLPELPVTGLSEHAAHIWRKIESFSKTPTKLALMQDGLVEWVRKGNRYVGLGHPRQCFHANAWDPLHDEDIPFEKRPSYLGFRLIKRQANDH